MTMTARFVQTLISPLEGVSNSAWERFVKTLEVQLSSATSESGGFGAYSMRPQRLIELGYAQKLPPTRTAAGRQIQECEFVLPWTKKRFCTDALVQFEAFSKSNVVYYRALMNGELKKPKEVSLSGALAILHKGGEGALRAWPKLFTDTRDFYERAKGIF